MHESLKNITEEKLEEIKKAVDQYNATCAFGRIEFEIHLSWDALVKFGFQELFVIPQRERIADMIKDIIKDDATLLAAFDTAQCYANRSRYISYIKLLVDSLIRKKEVTKDEADDFMKDIGSCEITHLKELYEKMLPRNITSPMPSNFIESILITDILSRKHLTLRKGQDDKER